MSLESLMTASQRLSVSVETLAALGAQLRFLLNGIDGDSLVRALLNDVPRAVDRQLLEGVERHQQAAALALIQTMLRCSRTNRSLLTRAADRVGGRATADLPEGMNLR